jgi:hypothetical protein
MPVRYARGDGTNADNPLSLSRTSLEALLDHGSWYQRVIHDLKYHHFSYEVQFDNSRVRPIAIRKYIFRRKRGGAGGS